MKDDWIETLFIANTHDYILCSNRGRVYWVKVYEVPQGRATARPPDRQHVPLQEGEKINVVLPVKEFSADKFIFMATSLGTVKKTPLEAFSRPMKKGIIAVGLDEGDFPDRASITTARTT